MSLFDPTNFVSVPTSEFAKIGSALETTITSSLMDLSGTNGNADPTMLHNRLSLVDA